MSVAVGPLTTSTNGSNANGYPPYILPRGRGHLPRGRHRRQRHLRAVTGRVKCSYS